MLQLLINTAAETGAQQLIQTGRVVFDAYKDRTPLPEVITRNNGHEETAHYLEESTTRYFFHAVIGLFFKLY